MTLAEAIAYVQAQSVCAIAEIESMKAANRAASIAGFAPAYDADAFAAVADKYCINHNSVLTLFQDTWRT